MFQRKQLDAAWIEIRDEHGRRRQLQGQQAIEWLAKNLKVWVWQAETRPEGKAQ